MGLYLALHPGALPRVAHRALPADPPRPGARHSHRLRRLPARLHRRAAADDDVPRHADGDRAGRARRAVRAHFGVFTGLAAIVPFFGTLLATALPALFVITRPGRRLARALGGRLGIGVHLIEGNIVSPYIMSKQVDLPPVLTIVFVLIVGKLLGGLGLLVAVPGLAVIMVSCDASSSRASTRGRASAARPASARSCSVLPASEGGVLCRRRLSTSCPSSSGARRPAPAVDWRRSSSDAPTHPHAAAHGCRAIPLPDPRRRTVRPRDLQDRERLHPLHAGARRRRHRREARRHDRHRTCSASAATSRRRDAR